jgi:hypothetical protein
MVALLSAVGLVLRVIRCEQIIPKMTLKGFFNALTLRVDNPGYSPEQSVTYSSYKSVCEWQQKPHRYPSDKQLERLLTKESRRVSVSRSSGFGR